MTSKLIDLIKKYNLHPKKKLGQHFLNREDIIKKEIEFAQINFQDTVLEIGAGVGILTKYLAENAKKVYAIEKDEKYTQLLKAELSKYSNIEIIKADITKIDWPKANKIVSNIPYQISSKIMEKIKGYYFDIAILCIQKEFAQRLIASPKDKNYSKLSVFSHFYFDIKKLLEVSPNSFYPPPKVTSEIIEIKKNKKVDLDNENKFFKFIKSIFCYKKKNLKNALKFSNLEYKNIDNSFLQKKVKDLNLDELIQIFSQL